MTNTICTGIQKSMDELVSAGVDDARMDGVLDHIETCQECGAHFELLTRLRSEDLVDEPDDASFLEMRRNVIRGIRTGGADSTTFVEKMRALFAQPGFALGLAVLMLAAGFIAGTKSRRMTWPDTASPVMVASSDDPLVDEIQLAAARHTAFEDVMNAPYEYSNVRVTEQEDGLIGLSFDVSRHVEAAVPKNDPMVNEVLVQSLLGEASVGTKLRAISESNAMDSKVKEALIRTMINDENLGVRLRAQGRLVALKGDSDVEKALLDVLKTEESVQMRLEAIDYLTEGNVQPELVREAVLGEDDEPRVDAVYVRAMKYVNESN